jgi:hypothetical protein
MKYFIYTLKEEHFQTFLLVKYVQNLKECDAGSRNRVRLIVGRYL